MTSPAEYGELMAVAHEHAVRAGAEVQHAAFTDSREASEVLVARGRLLGAVAHHVEVVLGPVRVATWRAIRPVQSGADVPDAAGRIPQAVVSWISALRTAADVSHEAEPDGSGDRDVNAAVVELRAARDMVRAASDLIATHRGLDGALRPGAPFPLAAADLGGLLARAIDVACVIASNEPWALRAREAGVPRRELDRALPLDSPLRVHTQAVSQLLGDPVSTIDAVTVARPAIDTADPAIEWRLRTDRIRARMEQHAADGRVSARTLHDVASLTLVVHHVLTTSHRTDIARADMDPLAAARLVTHLAPLRSAEPADPTIRADVQRLLDIAHPRRATTMDTGDRIRMLRAIEASVPTLAAAQATATRLATALTDAWIPARRLPGYLRSPHPPGRAVQPAPTFRPDRTDGVDHARHPTLT